MSRLRIIGSLMVIGGGVLFVVALAALPYYSFPRLENLGGGEVTVWDLTTRGPVILTMVAVAAILAAAGGQLTDEIVLLAPAAAVSKGPESPGPFAFSGEWEAGLWHGLRAPAVSSSAVTRLAASAGTASGRRPAESRSSVCSASGARPATPMG